MNEVVRATVDGCGVAREREGESETGSGRAEREEERRDGLARWRDGETYRRSMRETEKGKPRRIPRYHDN